MAGANGMVGRVEDLDGKGTSAVPGTQLTDQLLEQVEGSLFSKLSPAKIHGAPREFMTTRVIPLLF